MSEKLVFITPGPYRKLSDLDKFKELSQYFSGDVITSSNKDEVLKSNVIGRFRLHAIRFSYDKQVRYNTRFMFYCIWFAVMARIFGRKYDLVVTYDPLRSGMLGATIAWILKAKFAPEVNGVYTSPAEYLDSGERLMCKVKKIMYPLLEGRVLGRADGIKIQFPGQIDPFRKQVGNKIVRQFHNYIHIDRFNCVAGKEKKEILFVGFPFKRKGVDLLIRAFKEISEEFPEWRLKILGWFPNTEEVTACINGHPQIDYHPPVPTTEMPQHMAECSIFAMPSRSDALPRVLIESMVAAKPRVGTNVDGIPILIKDGVDGFLFEQENVADLAEKLKILMRDGRLRERMGKAGRERALKQFSKKEYFNHVVRFYREVIYQH